MCGYIYIEPCGYFCRYCAKVFCLYHKKIVTDIKHKEELKVRDAIVSASNGLCKQKSVRHYEQDRE